MIRLFIYVSYFCSAVAAFADTVVPVRTIRADTIITDGDVTVRSGHVEGAADNLSYVIGQEAKTTLYAGRPIRWSDVGPPALVSRNQIVPLIFSGPGLVISTDGRSLERGAVGDRVRVMNLGSRATLFGQVQPDGSVKVTK